MNRIFGVVLAATWLIAMTALIQRDVVPFWSVQEAPGHIAPNGTFQVAICNDAGHRIGTTWITSSATGHITTVHSTTLLDLRPIAGLLRLQEPLRCETSLIYVADGVLDQFRLRLEGAGVPIRVVGERCGRDFACTTKIGSLTKSVPLDGRLSECLAESLRPFTHLAGLHVGQTWRIRLLDPFSLLVGRGPEIKLHLVSVTRRETISHNGSRVECFRVETDNSVAWADDSGRVLRQEVQLPLVGRCILTDEPYSRAALEAALAPWTDHLPIDEDDVAAQ